MIKLLIFILLLVFIVKNTYFKENLIGFKKNRNEETDNLSDTIKIPKLTFVSNKDCPILYKLFKDIKDSSQKKMERIEALRFRNRIQSTFYNTNEIVSTEYQIIDLIKQDTSTEILPNFKFKYKNDDSNIINYISSKDKHLEITHKESFGVKGDFTIDDLCRFSNYCFTKLTSKIVPISKLTLNNAAMYAHECPVCNNNNGAYNIVPVRVVQQCLKEGKEFTRAKCTHCAVNILVYFTDSSPTDFTNLKNLSTSTPETYTEIGNIDLIKN